MADPKVSMSPQQIGYESPGATVRFGLIALATDMTTEPDFVQIFPPEAIVHTTRVHYANPTTPENLRKMAPLLTDAAALITPGVPLVGICYSCTSASATIGANQSSTLRRPSACSIWSARCRVRLIRLASSGPELAG